MSAPFGTTIPKIKTFHSTNLEDLASQVQTYVRATSPESHYVIDLEFFASNVGNGITFFTCSVLWTTSGTLNTQSVTAIMTEASAFAAAVQAVVDLAVGETRYNTIIKLGSINYPNLGNVGLSMPCALIYKRRDP